MSEGLMRRHHSSPAPALMPENEDILREILIRISPLPSSLPRASVVCKRWLRLLSDPQFHRQFCAHHRAAPLLGFFADKRGIPFFISTLEPPDCIPSARLSFDFPQDEGWSVCCCRHGLVLLSSWKRNEIAVWNPITREQRRVALPPLNRGPRVILRQDLVCEDISKQAFRVVSLWSDCDLSQVDSQVFASVYDSETAVWGNPVSTTIRGSLASNPGTLVRNSLFWFLFGTGSLEILQFDMDKHGFDVIAFPMDTHVAPDSSFQLLRMEDGELGLAISLKDSERIQVWERKANGASKWMLQQEIRLRKLLSLWVVKPSLVGYDEDGHAIIVSTYDGVFIIQMKSLQFKKLFKDKNMKMYHTYRDFYAIGRGIGSGDVGAETLNNN